MFYVGGVIIGGIITYLILKKKIIKQRKLRRLKWTLKPFKYLVGLIVYKT